MGWLPVGKVPDVRIISPCGCGNRAPVAAYSQKRRENAEPMEALELSLEENDPASFCLSAELVFGQESQLPEGIGQVEQVEGGPHSSMMAFGSEALNRCRLSTEERYGEMPLRSPCWLT